MNHAGWVAWVLVVIAFVVLAWGTRTDHTDLVKARAQLVELAGHHHSPADRLTALEEFATSLGEVVVAIEQSRPGTGRHAHVTDPKTTPIPLVQPGGPR